MSTSASGPGGAVEASHRVNIIDCTLREGCQAPGVTFTAEQSAEIAGHLVECGVDMIECGHAVVSRDERARIKAVIAAAGDLPVLVHARARQDDVDAVQETGASWVGIFLGFNGHTQRGRVVGATVADLIAMACQAVSRAVELGLQVRFTAEDAGRTDPEVLECAFAAAVDAGVSRICFADTVGLMEPADVHRAAHRLRRRFPDLPLEFHLHNDRGLSTANAMAALDAGADWISCSVNGVGERAGITDLVTLLANLHVKCVRQLPAPAVLRRLSELVAAITRIPVDPMHPVVGGHAFMHTSRLHQRGVTVDPMVYSWIDPATVGGLISLATERRWRLDDLIIKPEIRSATELRHHRHGPGDRYMLIDNGKLDGCGLYCIVRHVPSGDPGPGHVDVHRHNVDSLFVFLGTGDGLTGLSASVRVGDEERVVSSPCSVFIPAAMNHSYRVVRGPGLFLNVVLAGTYQKGLLE